MIPTAAFSNDRKYRYALWRWWARRPFAMFIGLNPSTADETNDDPTIRRCVGFASRWDYGGIIMTNLFAVRATDPREMMQDPEPIGPDNDTWILKLSKQAGIIIAAWGARGGHLHRDKAVCNLLSNLKCLGITKDGYPRHPLYLRKDIAIVPLRREERDR